MQNILSKYSYYIIASTQILVGLVVKFFLVDTDLGARFKNYNHKLLASDILFIFAIILIGIGLFFNSIKNNTKTSLKNSTIIVSAFLLIPISSVLALTPILETIYPGKVGDSNLLTCVMVLTSIGTIAVFAWIILFITIILKQLFRLLTIKEMNKKT